MSVNTHWRNVLEYLFVCKIAKITSLVDIPTHAIQEATAELELDSCCSDILYPRCKKECYQSSFLPATVTLVLHCLLLQGGPLCTLLLGVVRIYTKRFDPLRCELTVAPRSALRLSNEVCDKSGSQS